VTQDHSHSGSASNAQGTGTPGVQPRLLRHRRPRRDATLVRLRDGGVQVRNEVMDFHDRRLVFLVGPGGVTIELAEWVTATDE